MYSRTMGVTNQTVLPGYYVQQYADAVTANKDAEIARLRDELAAVKGELDTLNKQLDMDPRFQKLASKTPKDAASPTK